MSKDVSIKIVTQEGRTENKKFEDYELDMWCDTLARAEEIKADPVKMAALKDKLEQKSKAVKSLDDLRKLAKKKIDREEQYQDGHADEGEEVEKDKKSKQVESFDI